MGCLLPPFRRMGHSLLPIRNQIHQTHLRVQMTPTFPSLFYLSYAFSCDLVRSCLLRQVGGDLVRSCLVRQVGHLVRWTCQEIAIRGGHLVRFPHSCRFSLVLIYSPEVVEYYSSSSSEWSLLALKNFYFVVC